MSTFNIEVAGGSSVRLPTAGKYCDRDIIVTATGGGSAEEGSKGEAVKSFTEYALYSGVATSFLEAGKQYYVEDVLFTAEDQGSYIAPPNGTVIDNGENSGTVQWDGSTWGVDDWGNAPDETRTITFYKVVGETYTESGGTEQLDTPVYSRDPSNLCISAYYAVAVTYNYYVDGILALSTTDAYLGFDSYVPTDGDSHNITITASADGYITSAHSAPCTVYYDSNSMIWFDGEPTSSGASPLHAVVSSDGVVVMRTTDYARWFYVYIRYEESVDNAPIAWASEVYAGVDGTDFPQYLAEKSLKSIFDECGVAYPSQGTTLYVQVIASDEVVDPETIVQTIWQSAWESESGSGGGGISDRGVAIKSFTESELNSGISEAFLEEGKQYYVERVKFTATTGGAIDYIYPDSSTLIDNGSNNGSVTGDAESWGVYDWGNAPSEERGVTFYKVVGETYSA